MENYSLDGELQPGRKLLRFGPPRRVRFGMFLLGQIDRQLDRRPHRSGIGLVPSDNIKRRPVIGAGADDRQPNRQFTA